MVLDQQMADKINDMNNLISELNKQLDNIEMKMLSTKSDTMADESQEKVSFEYDDKILQSEAQLAQDKEIQSEDVIELDELTIENMIIMEFINGHAFGDLALTNRDLNVSEVVVNELILKNYENYKKIIGKTNKIDHEEMVVAASENFVPTTGIVDKLTLNSLMVDGFINRLDISVLNELALKLRGDQILESEINFEVLQGASLQTSSSISNRKIDDIVRIKDGSFAVEQTVQFVNPVFINELIVNQRINNINVVKGNFNILLKRSDHDQVIQVMKTFDEVKLLSPIVLQGKIKKSNLNHINPIVSITKDIFLNGKIAYQPPLTNDELYNFHWLHTGDYEIKGNTTILRIIRGENIYGGGGKYNVRDLLTDGLRLDTPVIDQIFEFVQPIKINNLLSNSVNNVDVSKFVRTGEIQTVYGLKNFTGDLQIKNGLCDALSVNDIDLSVLNETVLKKFGAQTIDGKIHFNGIRAKRWDYVFLSIKLFS